MSPTSPILNYRYQLKTFICALLVQNIPSLVLYLFKNNNNMVLKKREQCAQHCPFGILCPNSGLLFKLVNDC